MVDKSVQKKGKNHFDTRNEEDFDRLTKWKNGENIGKENFSFFGFFSKSLNMRIDKMDSHHHQDNTWRLRQDQ